jgi:hypothetical protein
MDELSPLDRILLACIKYLGKHPCPRCLVCKIDIPALGSKHDQQQRVTGKRKDDNVRRKEIERVRKWIYRDGMAITSVYVDRILGPKSLFPTRVGH